MKICYINNERKLQAITDSIKHWEENKKAISELRKRNNTCRFNYYAREIRGDSERLIFGYRSVHCALCKLLKEEIKYQKVRFRSSNPIKLCEELCVLQGCHLKTNPWYKMANSIKAFVCSNFGTERSWSDLPVTPGLVVILNKHTDLIIKRLYKIKAEVERCQQKKG